MHELDPLNTPFSQAECKDYSYCVATFLEKYLKKVVSFPQALSVEYTLLVEDKVKQITIYTHPLDMGHVIGKEGKMVSAIKAFVSGVKAKDGFSYKIVVFASKSSDKNPHVLGDQTP
ncbi:KH domain-containing protein [Helicobacter pylori]